ncbi:glutamate--cysteine ligase [Monoraphidium neglectum]|uniref:Glutamate--cysteine ligase n=1 Tax=Monoraphidium neglectum TaxID=145388 RepID=A0A0D2IY06_9CHLO|nr:glutamate--cysteine ligase [Monoraphidium neglectum]KIY92812.1 glutamate--cysteine ligase [Monoraphidium neglectum]|eukprot:XP_013891832.1 glutamate--cysteine ligase [Monoraphidium neglectum]
MLQSGWLRRAIAEGTVGVHGLRTPFRGGTVRDLSLKVLDIARGGLERRGHDEASFLKSLQVIAESGKTPADALLELYEGKWGRSVDPYYDELQY